MHTRGPQHRIELPAIPAVVRAARVVVAEERSAVRRSGLLGGALGLVLGLAMAAAWLYQGAFLVESVVGGVFMAELWVGAPAGLVAYTLLRTDRAELEDARAIEEAWDARRARWAQDVVDASPDIEEEAAAWAEIASGRHRIGARLG